MLNLWCRKALSTKWIASAAQWYHWCWISDAERRWAQLDKHLEKGIYCVLNLWCRKALSTRLTWSHRSQMESVESLMPKGVEHKNIEKRSRSRECVESLMPKGVEHNMHQVRLWLRLNVLNLWCRKALSTKIIITISRANYGVESLMPKGVEHP